MRNIISIFILLTGFQVKAETLILSYKKATRSKPVFMGHSLSQTSEVLKKNQKMLGTFASGYGLTDTSTLGLSPWLLALYNMPNFILRNQFSLNATTKIGLHLGYMKTLPYALNFYKMETAYANLILSKKWNPIVTSHLQHNFMYFVDDERPFSIRAVGAEKKSQMSLSLLNEIRLDPKQDISMALETGVIAYNEKISMLHFGISIFKKFKSFLIQLGVSVSATENIQSSDFLYIGQRELPPGEERSLLTHPELQVQYFF